MDRAMARRRSGPFQIKAAIAALHVRDAPGGGPDCQQIVLLYDALLRMEPTPVVRLNRAVALAEAGMLPAALREIDALAVALDRSPQVHAARADLLRRLGRGPESETACDRAIVLAPTFADAAFLRAPVTSGHCAGRCRGSDARAKKRPSRSSAQVQQGGMRVARKTQRHRRG